MTSRQVLSVLVTISLLLIVLACRSRDEIPGEPSDPPPAEPQGTFQGTYVSFDLRTRVETAVPFVHPESNASGARFMGGREGGLPADAPVPLVFEELKEVGNPTAPEFSAHGRLLSTATGPDGMRGSGECSATLIGPRHVLTAAHCVFTDLQSTLSEHVWADQVWFVPAPAGAAGPFGEASGEVIYTFKGWRDDLDFHHDLAIVSLGRPVGFLAGWRGFGTHPFCEYWEEAGWTVIGYLGANMHARTGSFDLCPELPAPAQFEVDLTIEFGMSGGGAVKNFMEDGVAHKIVWGTLYGLRSEPNDLTIRRAVVRLDRNKYYAAKVAEEVSAPDEADLVVLNFRMPRVNLWENEPVEDLNFVIGNVGKQTFSGPVSVELYLSEDDQIDENTDTLVMSHTEELALDRDASIRLTLPGAPPVVPAGTPRGFYFLGIRLNIQDANDANDRTAGFDTAEFRVLHHGEFPLDDLLSGARTSGPLPGAP